MMAEVRLALAKASDPRVVRILLLSLALVLAAVAAGGAGDVYAACPTTGGSGGSCGGY